MILRWQDITANGSTALQVFGKLENVNVSVCNFDRAARYGLAVNQNIKFNGKGINKVEFKYGGIFSKSDVDILGYHGNTHLSAFQPHDSRVFHAIWFSYRAKALLLKLQAIFNKDGLGEVVQAKTS